MTVLDIRARATALKLLTKFGKSCTLKSGVAGTYDPTTGSTATTVASYPIKLYLDQPNRSELQGGQVINTDEVAIFAALGLPVEPSLNDMITIDGKDRLVKMVTHIWSGEQIALYRVGLQT